MMGVDLHHHWPAVLSDRRFHRQVIDVRLEIFFALPAVATKPLPEISLTVEQADANQRDAKIRCALDVIARQNSESARIDRERLMQAKFRREISYRARAQHTGMSRTPGSL